MIFIMAINSINVLDKIQNNTSTISSSIDQSVIYDYIYGDIPSRVSYYIVLFLIVTIGSFLSLTIVIYENFGADPMKRTIINRLHSLIFSNLVIQFWIWGLFRILRDLYGLLPSEKLIFALCTAQSIGLSSVLFTTERTIFQFLYVVIWKSVRPINDEFWVKFLAVSSYSVAFFSSSIAHFCGRGSSWDQGQIIDIKDKENLDL